MYKRSGGTSYMHECSECAMFKDGKKSRCMSYEEDADWHSNWTACKFFTDRTTVNEDEPQGQISIFDLL